jgi:molybdopterin-synthase adenylyltransferase
VIQLARGAAAWLNARFGRRPDEVQQPTPRLVDLRLGAQLFSDVRAHVEDFIRGEEAGFLLCSLSRCENRDVLLGREWLPIPDEVIERNMNGSVLSWSAAFNSDVLQRAVQGEMTPVLVHSHGSPGPRFSPDDQRKERRVFGAFSRILGPIPTGSIVLGLGDAAGSFWTSGRNDGLTFRRISVIGDAIDHWYAPDAPRLDRNERNRLNRQTLAIGPGSDRKLAEATVAIVGVSGGGSHVAQQLIHQGIGRIFPVDDDIIDETNLGRVVGAVASDIDITAKTKMVKRVAAAVDPSIDVVEIPSRFPTTASIAALKEADVVVACLDRFDARAAVNEFCRRHLIPLLDVGMTIRTSGETLTRADGQLIVSLPEHTCMRCYFITDAVLAKEQAEAPAGYDPDPDRPGDPQVVSMNGTLASEACNCVLDLVTGYSGGARGARHWQYNGRTGTLVPSQLPPRRPDCSACAQEGHGEPPLVLQQTPSRSNQNLASVNRATSKSGSRQDRSQEPSAKRFSADGAPQATGAVTAAISRRGRPTALGKFFPPL